MRNQGKAKFAGWQGLLACAVLGALLAACGGQSAAVGPMGSARLALWLAQKDELLAVEGADYALIMTGWFEAAEAEALSARNSASVFLAGLTHTWISDDPGWLEFLITVANGGDPNGPRQITNDMYLMLDDDGDGALDSRCSPPGWPQIWAMDPRHSGWRELILAFYEIAAAQTQHDGIVIDMVDAYPFCDGGWSAGVPTPLEADDWVAAQAELLALLREQTATDKWLFANAGRDFPAGSPFPQYLNGYLLENFLGEWGATLEEGLASAQRALETTVPPHIVVFAADTDDSGVIDWARFRTGLAASLLLDNTYFAFDFGAREHGGVQDWWFPEYYNFDLGAPLGAYIRLDGVYMRDFELGKVVVAAESVATVTFLEPHVEIGSGASGLDFSVPQGDAAIFVRINN